MSTAEQLPDRFVNHFSVDVPYGGIDGGFGEVVAAEIIQPGDDFVGMGKFLPVQQRHQRTSQHVDEIYIATTITVAEPTVSWA